MEIHSQSKFQSKAEKYRTCQKLVEITRKLAEIIIGLVKRLGLRYDQTNFLSKNNFEGKFECGSAQLNLFSGYNPIKQGKIDNGTSWGKNML